MRIIVSILLAFIWSGEAQGAKHLYKEREYQERWCDKAGGVTEYVLPDKARVDCLTEEYAIEFDFAAKWAEAIGQAMYYSITTKKKPGIVLIIEDPKEERYFGRLKVVAEKFDIKVWIVGPEILE